MKVADRHYRTIWPNEDGRSVDIIDQRWLPHDFRVETVGTVDGVATAIRDMWVRGAPLIGVTAAYGVAIQVLGAASYAAPLLSTLVLIAAGVAEPSLRILAACVLITGGAALAAKSLFLRKPVATESGAEASESGAGASEGGARA